MPRSRSSRASRPVMRPAPAPAPARQTPPAAPPAQYQQQQRRAGIGSTIADGMAFGGGSAVAHRAVDSLMGPRTVTHEAAQNPTAAPTTAAQPQGFDACENQAKAFKDCLSFNVDDIGKCQFYVDMLNECRRSGGGGAPQQAPNWS
ncbi:hypothetical protein M758_6G098300 [Ceratodon purpureus]|uniref:CHCH domain-containing protein n=1 Tax=Ceratodon purpureus TaxID=3225 RepID=A0A8T0HDK3_CERPU|nr:hypothetical protein KC19_6G101900 [Ceratodon purpureus]KAG0613377.1 hypothetical protein M758_6G098300 [Ceratodon purpureus]